MGAGFARGIVLARFRDPSRLRDLALQQLVRDLRKRGERPAHYELAPGAPGGTMAHSIVVKDAGGAQLGAVWADTGDDGELRVHTLIALQPAGDR